MEKVLHQVEKLVGKNPKIATVKRGYRGNKQIGQTNIMIPGSSKKRMSKYQINKRRKLHRRRAAIEPIIGHIKQNHKLNRNFYKVIVRNNINIMLAAAVFNFKRMMNKWKSSFIQFFVNLFYSFLFYINLFRKQKLAF